MYFDIGPRVFSYLTCFCMFSNFSPHILSYISNTSLCHCLSQSQYIWRTVNSRNHQTCGVLWTSYLMSGMQLIRLEKHEKAEHAVCNEEKKSLSEEEIAILATF